MNTSENPYQYKPKETYPKRGHCDDHSGFSCVIKIPRDPENQGTGEWNLGRSLLIVLFVHVAVIAAIFIFHNWHHLMIDFLDLISKLGCNCGGGHGVVLSGGISE